MKTAPIVIVNASMELSREKLDALTDEDLRWLEAEVSKRMQRHFEIQQALLLYGIET